ncbi:uncharacterized protein DUF2735 [Hoeflea marina]|uniref:Uncharacterized protein DUF2735 n=1 Tax=Hoeflea marina TaxID=274592 RepID=A0A317PH74_9HYPH|nr:DUF2735 domain-containing protein [Hoeflea marina]PWV98241.1 uncharacterized protein DUF2735 [Hoeflea marina]
MAQAALQGTAKVYQFPVGGRAGFAEAQKAKLKEAERLRQISESVVDDCWYHGAAIRESDPS